MSLRLKDHRRRARKARALAALKKEADFRAGNDVLQQLYDYGRIISQTKHVDLSTKSVGMPIRIQPMPMLGLDFKHVTYRMAVDQSLHRLRGMDPGIHRQEAAIELAKHMLTEGLITEKVQHIPQRHIVLMQWDCFIGKAER